MTAIKTFPIGVHLAAHANLSDAERAALVLGRCDGCKHNGYSAPHGQALKPTAHSRCLSLQADIPMVIGDKGAWLASMKPPNCEQRRSP